MTTAPPAPPAPPRKAPPPAPTKAATTADFTFEESTGVVVGSPQIVVVYGPGGIGKTSLAANVRNVGRKPKLVDLERGSAHVSVDRVAIDSWDALLAYLRDESRWSSYDTVVIDSLTRAEEMATAWTLANVPKEGGVFVKSLEGYGYGKGYQHVYETFLVLLSELDRHARAGRSIICTTHDCTANVPNPDGDDFIRYEPRLQSPSSGKASIRLRVREWCDHLLFVRYDVAVVEDAKGKSKGQGKGTRCIYPVELPTHMAKSRTLADPIVFEKDSDEIWRQIFTVA